jgi:hypothetical protein
MARGGHREGAGRKPGSVNVATAKAREAAEAGGEMPLDFMLRIMRDEAAERSERLDMAKAAAPYVHAKLSSIEASGPNGAPLIPALNVSFVRPAT